MQTKIIPAITSLLMMWTIFLVLMYYGQFGGDPEIHIIFAKNLIEGFPLQFNRGIYSGGETSPGYMILLSILSVILPLPIQYILKAISYASLCYIMKALFDATKDNGGRASLFPSLLFSSICFVEFQVSLGMENILFALLALLLVRYTDRISLRANNIKLLLLGISIFLLFYLRPEAVFIIIYLITLSALEREMRWLIPAIVSILLIGFTYFYINFITGVEPQSAGIIRAFTSKSESYNLVVNGYNVFISKKPFLYLPYAVPFAAILYYNKSYLKKNDIASLFALFLLPLTLHILNVLPNTHYSRYALYSYLLFFYVFAKTAYHRTKSYYLCILALCVLTFSIFENVQRKSLPGHTVEKSMYEMNNQYRDTLSNELYSKVKGSGERIAIALQEVQLRARLDNRYIVWSLDGITDNALSKFISNGSIDHFSYIKYRDIKYLQGPLFNYNYNKYAPSLASYRFDAEGISQCINGVSLIDIKYRSFYRVKYCD